MKNWRSILRLGVMSLVCAMLICGAAAGVWAANISAADVKVPILMYHHINPRYDEGNSSANLTPEEFRLHMMTLQTKNYHAISLQDYYDHVVNGTALPENPIVITFDDGYSSNYEEAFPILKELNIPATIFVVTDTVGETPAGGKVNYAHFTWAQAREMQESGLIDIQSHSGTHCKMAETSVDQMQRELRRSKYLIEKNVGKTCDMFAYPFGSYNAQTKQAARQAGYKMQILVGDIVKDYANEVNVRSEGAESLKRITVRGHMSNLELLDAIETAKAAK
uniref:NodB homology domain-containing protein n=1 Tax=uncultured Bacillota bacterium TaxID=344338 RepID=A0A650EMY5_9FIRM|nr:hypothetical protein Firmicute1046_0890 [uncultured Firmicutes bacterium]